MLKILLLQSLVAIYQLLTKINSKKNKTRSGHKEFALGHISPDKFFCPVLNYNLEYKKDMKSLAGLPLPDGS